MTVPLLLDETQTMLRDSVAGCLADFGGVGQLRDMRDRNDDESFSRVLWSTFADMGFAGVIADERDGGLALGQVEGGVILEQIGRNLAASPFLSTAVGAVIALSAANEDIRSHWSAPIASGQAVAAIAIDESAAHDPARSVSIARSLGGGRYRLTGRKTFVHHGHVADLLIVSAVVEGKGGGIGLLALDRESPGIQASPKRLADANLYADIAFSDVELDSAAILCTGGDGEGVPFQRMLDALALGTAAELVGIGSEVFERTLAFLKERRQFGSLIGGFQALQHRMASLYGELEVARAAVIQAQALADAGSDEASAAAAVAKAFADHATMQAVQEGVQLHGGIGMTDELDIGLFMKRARVLGALYGNADFHAERYARLSGY